MHNAQMAAAGRSWELVVPGARIFFPVECGGTIAPNPEVSVSSALRAAFMCSGRGTVPDDYGLTLLAISRNDAPDRCQRHALSSGPNAGGGIRRLEAAS